MKNFIFILTISSFLFGTINISNAQYCTVQSTYPHLNSIADVSVGSFSHTSGVSTYSDFTSEIITLSPGLDYPITLHNTTGYAVSWAMWIDFNNDGDFDDPGEQVLPGIYCPTPYTGQISIPASATGSTRLRVTQGIGEIMTDACYSPCMGEIEDYTVDFGGDPPPPLDPPVAPGSVSASATTVCEGQSSVLTYTGGSGTTFGWYTGSCGGTLIGTGNNFTVSPIATTAYYGRWENAVGNSTCQTVTITVNPLPDAPGSVSASATAVCEGQNSVLTYTGGSGTTFKWYTGSCGGTLAGTGNNLTVSPTETTAYYGRWENGCGNSICQTVTITVITLPVAPGSVSASATTVEEGQSSVLTYTGGSGTVFRWYTGSCGGTLIGTGNNFTVLPTATTAYYGRWESDCGNSTCQTVTITVNPPPPVFPWSSNGNGIFYLGSVGVSTTSPKPKLAVDGTITSKVSVITQTNWPDFVFKSDYKLPSLNCVEDFIKENGHLPGVPSEDYIKKNGNNLGETDVILLQKIEELTLYMIDIDEKYKEIEDEIKQLKNK